MKKFILLVCMILMCGEAFARFKMRRSSFGRSSFRKSRSFFKSKKTKSFWGKKKTTKTRSIIKKKPTRTKTKVINNHTTVYRDRGTSIGGGILNAYINYQIMKMIFNPKTGQMECPSGSLLNTQINQCVGQQVQNSPMQAQPVATPETGIKQSTNTDSWD